MRNAIIGNIVLFSCCEMLSGCAIGYNTALFMTKSNIGLDVDTKPPTAEISIARREGVLEPGFEAGKTPPVFARFGTSADTQNGEGTTNTIERFFWGVSSVFAGGNAAVFASKTPNTSSAELGKDNDSETVGNRESASRCLTAPPIGKPELFGIQLGDVKLPEPGEIRPFAFGTDTSFGLKVAWSGITGSIPDTFRLGFMRKEIAIAPVFGRPNSDKDCPYLVDMPSFFATIKIAGDVGVFGLPKNEYSQIFATGKAADNIAQKAFIQQGIQELVADHTFTYAPDTNSTCIRDWIGDDEKRRQETQDWWEKDKKKSTLITDFIEGSEYKQDRVEFIGKKQINCAPENAQG